ncbi:DUF1858 domain-containing protein [Natroniella sulfidigena]|uniref:DUF1858 domain-containing protein n=1 Tax=Natroniella sulfidigena TaxID=723921 RepID=UPI002009E767|nr:DUF1858 domain-containing protein [Natroniella sulfidigena]MCK8818152.1 DUF1858 domain-containing protein [Natroniella sulfidigena]
MKITKQTSILELIQHYPEANQILAFYNLECARCVGANSDSLEVAAEVNQVDLERLLADLKKLENNN